MSKSLRLPLLLLPVLLLGGIAYWMSAGPGATVGAGGAGLGMGPAPLDPGGTEPDRPATTNLVTGPATSDAPARAVGADLAAERAELASGRAHAGGSWKPPSDTVWVEGVVELPEGTPADERVIVVASGRRFVGRSGQPDEYAAPIAADGRFRVGFAAGTRKGRLWVQGRYVYSDEAYTLNPYAPDEEGVLLKPELGGRVEVEVLPPRALAFDRDVLEGLSVEARGGMWRGIPTIEGVRLSESRFELGGLRAGQEYLIKALSPHYADGTLEEVTGDEGRSKTVQVALFQGAKLTGTVRDPQGERILHAKVSAMTAQVANQRNPFFNQGSDDVSERGDGTFELVGVPAGEMVLVVEADGFLEQKVDLGELRDAEERLGLEITLVKGRTVSGVVQWPDGSPADGALVRLSQKSGIGNWDVEKIMGEITVRADGKFEFSALEEGRCTLTAECYERGYELPEDASLRERMLGNAPLWRAFDDEIPPNTPNLVLTLNEGSPLAGTVTDDQGEPLTSFQVIATPARDNILSASARKPVKDRFRSEDGAFVLEGLQPGHWTVSARATGYGEGDEVAVRVPGTQEVQLRVPRAARISGTVRGPDGSLVESARVNAEHGEGKDANTKTDRKGVFSLGRLDPGSVELHVSSDDWASSLPVSLELAAGEHRENFVLTLRRGGELICQLHPEAGRREGRDVNLSGASWNSGSTDSDGEVVFKGLEPGHYEVTLQPDQDAQGQPSGGGRNNWVLRNARKKTAEVDVADGERVVLVLGEPSPSAVRIRGRVTAGGQPVAGALVMVTLPTGGDEAIDAREADGDGSFELLVDEPGRYRFLVGREVGQQTGFDLEVPATPVFHRDFELPTTALTGLVRGPDGQPQAEAWLTLTAVQDGQEVGGRWLAQRRVQTGEDGRYRFEELSAGTYNLRVASSNRSEVDRPASILLEGQVIEDKDRNLDIDLPASGRVEGEVLDASGSAVSGANVEACNQAGVAISSWNRARSGQGGRYQLEGLPPGDVWLRARQGGRTSDLVKAEVRANGTVNARLELPVE